MFCGDFDQAANVQDALAEGMETVAMLGCRFDADTSLEVICAENEPYTESPIPDPEGGVFTIIYTSGTTGNPKGVTHMHQTPGHVVPRGRQASATGQPQQRSPPGAATPG